MKAWIVERHGGTDALVQKELPIPEPGPMEARVKVGMVGLNHLDLWVRNGVSGHKFPLPLVPGCDTIGTLDKLGPIDSLAGDQLKGLGLILGSRVIVNPCRGCGVCESCLRGFVPTCRQFGIIGETTDGGCREYSIVPLRNLIRIPDGVSDQDAVTFPTAGITAWSMLTRKTEIKPGEKILIQAAGSGVSVFAIQLAKLLGAEVSTTVRGPERIQKALDLGADEVLETSKRGLLEQIGKKRFDVILDHVGVATIHESLKALNWGGRIGICGATSGAEVSIDLKLIFFKNLSVFGTTMGGQSDLVELLRLAQLKKIKGVVHKVFKFSDLKDAYNELEKGKIFGKVLIQI